MAVNVTIRFPQIDAAGIMFYPRCFELLTRYFPESPLESAPFSIKTRFLRPLRLGDQIDIQFAEDGERWAFSACKGAVEHFRVESMTGASEHEQISGHVTQDGILGAWACGPSGAMLLSRSFEYLNVAVEETLEQVLGMPFHDMHVARGIGIPTAEFATVVKALPRGGQRVCMKTRIDSVGRKSLTLRHQLRSDGACLVDNTQTIVFVEMLRNDYRSIPIPDDMRKQLEASVDVAA